MSDLHGRSRSYCHCYRRVQFALAISILAVTSFQHPSRLVVSAQVSKFASRPKLVDGASQKKKKKKHVNVDDGEFLSPWGKIFGRRKQDSEQEMVTDEHWRMDLIAAEFRVMLLSIISSVLIAVLSWVWYRVMGGTDSAKERIRGEKGGECITCLFMCCTPLSLQ